jgi:hypothetical protein
MPVSSDETAMMTSATFEFLLFRDISQTFAIWFQNPNG